VKLAYNSIRKYYPWEEIIILDDNSTDGTKDWLWGLEGDISNSESGDKNLVVYLHESRQIGHTVIYNKGAELARNEIFTIFHADMVCGPNYVENLLKHLKPGGVVAATRIEPPLHPEGREKIVKDFGTYDTDFRQEDFEKFVLEQQKENKDKTTKGIFAPWAMYKKDFQAIGGHDKLFCPFPYEDSDIFQRMILAGYDIKQSRDAFVYHFTCRGHRWTKEVQKDDLFYKLCVTKNMVHFIRKWGCWIENNENCYPVIHKKYDIGVKAKNCPAHLLPQIEPWFSCTYIQDEDLESKYVTLTQPGTPFNMAQRVKPFSFYKSHDIDITFDVSQMTGERLSAMTLLSKMIEDSGEVGEMEYDIFKIKINRLEDKTPQLINNDSEYYRNQLVSIPESDPYYTDELFKVFEEVKKHE